MSGYYNDYDDSRRRNGGGRRPVYEEDVIETRRSARAPRQMDLVRRRDDSEDSIEEVRREFPPGSAGGYVERRRVYRDAYPPAPQRARSVGRSSYDDTYYREDRRSRRSGRSRRDYSDSESSASPPPRHRERRKSISEQALAALGLGGAAAALTGKDKDRDRDRARSRSRGGRDRRRDYSSSRSRSRSRDTKEKYAQAAKAAVTAGVIEAWRSRKEPGGWQNQGKRIATAAIGAAGINKAIDKDPEKHSTRHIVEGALGGLASNRLINGSRSRSRSRAQGKDEKGGPGLGGIAAAGGLAAIAGQALNTYREKKRDDSRGRSRSRPRGGGSYSDDEDYNRPPKSSRRKSFSEKIYDGMDRGLAKFGLGESENHHPDYYVDKYGRRQNIDRDARPRGGGVEEKKHGSDTDSYSSEEEQKAEKKLYRKELVTAGLASVATIHAAHNVYQSMEKREARHKKVMEGKMTPEEARRLKSKALLQDAASVGIAALGIKGAMSEWKEMKDQRGEYKEHQKRLEEKREHRRAKIERGEWDPQTRRAIKKNSEPNMGDRYSRDAYEDAYYDAPRYQDGNPYATGGLPPPPMGSAPLRY